MRAPPPPSSERRPLGFLLAFALAHAGGTVGFLPFLSLLLPLKVEGVAGTERIALFTAAVVAGALVSSTTNIAFGWLSDRTGRRRAWVAAGALALALSFACVAMAQTPGAIIAAVMLFQAAINMLLGPLMAIIADEIPDEQRGLTGGLLALASPMGSAVSVGLVAAMALSEGARLGIVAAIVSICVTPLVLTRARPLPMQAQAPAQAEMLRRDLAVAWIARLLVQMAGVASSLYLLYYFESVAPGVPPAVLAPRVGHLLTVAYIVPLPIALLLGRLSDRSGRRKPVLVGAALVAALGLAGMAAARDWTGGAIAFGAFAIGSAVFVSLNTAFATLLLPDPRHRGRDLGILNLANTLPSLLGPALTWWLATPDDFAPLMTALAVLTLAGGAAMLAVRGRA